MTTIQATQSTTDLESNQLQLTGQLSSVLAMRYTPAGLPVTEATLTHQSTQQEAGLERQVSCEVSIKALGNLAHQLASATPGTRVKASGFLAAKSLKSRQLVLHLNTLEFIE